MNERLLQFIWQFQYFNKKSLVTSEDETLQVIKPGSLNQHQGPDFSEATIRIGNTTWVGNIEIHIRASDWYRHHHAADAHYYNIILHVVWENDTPVYDSNGHLFPVLVMEPLVPKHLLDCYTEMMEKNKTLPCSSFLPVLDDLSWIAWKERLVAERLERRTKHVLELHEQSNRNWETVCWWMLAANFGLQVNTSLFQSVIQSLSLPHLFRQTNQLHQLEALLFGQANLLHGKYTDPYALLLQKEYRFLKKKYHLQPVNKQPAFLRMRPAGFPTIRLAQLAMLLSLQQNLFSRIKETQELAEVIKLFSVTASEYWHTHYQFDETSIHQPKQVGTKMIENILINTVVPLLFAYGCYIKDETYKERAIEWLYDLAPEQNHITRQWKTSGVPNPSALDSQALVELTNHYCMHKHCLNCAVGNGILKRSV